MLLNFLCRNSGFSFFLEELLFKNLQGLCIIRSLIFKVQFCKKFSGSSRLKPWFSLLSFRICRLVFCDSLCILTPVYGTVNSFFKIFLTFRFFAYFFSAIADDNYPLIFVTSFPVTGWDSISTKHKTIIFLSSLYHAYRIRQKRLCKVSFTKPFPRNDRTWTCGLLTPSQARYHLRYIPIGKNISYFPLQCKLILIFFGRNSGESVARFQWQ